MEVGEEGKYIPIATLSLVTTTGMTCIKMGSDESRFNFSLIVRDKVTRPQLLKRKESRSGIEPRSFRFLTARPIRSWGTQIVFEQLDIQGK